MEFESFTRTLLAVFTVHATGTSHLKGHSGLEDPRSLVSMVAHVLTHTQTHAHTSVCFCYSVKFYTLFGKLQILPKWHINAVESVSGVHRKRDVRWKGPKASEEVW